MKKIILFTLVMTLVLCGVQAQKKNTTKNNIPPAIGSDGTSVATTADVPVIGLPPAAAGLETPLIEVMKERKTIREMVDEELPVDLVASLLWSAYGYNRPEENKRVVPSAVNVQEYDIYLFNREGIYLYDAQKNALILKVQGDYRTIISKQKHFAVAPISIVMVANYDRMKVFKATEDRDFYAAVDAGYISQNIYLFCASAKLATVACGGIDREAIHKVLDIKNGRAMLAHPVGLR